MPKTIMELAYRDCRFILDDSTYCAEQSVLGTSFCAEHVRVCYVPVERSRQCAPILLPVTMLAQPEPDEAEPVVPELPDMMHK